MSQFTVIGDPHVKPDNLEKIDKLFDSIEERGLPTIILGDVLDTKDLVRSKCLNLVYKRLEESELQFIILVGNHDLHSLHEKTHSLEPLKALRNVLIVDQPKVIDGILFVPYTHNLDEFRACVAQSKEEVAFIHQGINGFDYGNGYIAQNEIQIQELNKFQVVISGHFHKYQSKHNLTYLGTPFSHSFGEANQPKYIGTFDTKTRILEISPTEFPIHMSLDLNCANWPKQKTKLDKLVKSGDYVRIILTGPESKVLSFPKDEYPTVKFLERPNVEDALTVSVDESLSNDKKFTTWATEIRQLDDATVRLGLEILKHVS